MNLTKGIIKYLEKELEKQPAPSTEEVKSRKKIIKYFEESEGQCLGLSTLWSYGRRIADEPQEDEEKPKDNIHFFNHVEQLLTQWNGESPISQEDRADIERFISNVLLYQRFDRELAQKIGDSELILILNNPDQFNLPELMEDTKRGAPINSFHSYYACLTKDMLQKRLKDLIRPKSMIFLSTTQGKNKGGHVVSIYQNESDNKIHFYDSNRKYEIEIDDLPKLTKLLWDTFDPSTFQTAFVRTDASDIAFRNVAADIVRFDGDPRYTYLTSDKFTADPEELTAYFKDPNALGFRGSKTNAFIDSIEPALLYKILKDKDVTNEVKKALLQRCVTANKIPSCLAHFINNRHAKLLDDLIKENRIRQNQLSNFTEKPPIRENLGSLKSIRPAIEDFLKLYHDDMIDEEDFKVLDIYDALCIMSEMKPTQTDLFNELLMHCKKDLPLIVDSYDDNEQCDLSNLLCNIVGINQWEASESYFGRTRTANPKYIESQKKRMEIFLDKLHQDFHLPLSLNYLQSRGTEGSFTQIYVVPLILKAFEPVLQQKDDIAEEIVPAEAPSSAEEESFREIGLDEQEPQTQNNVPQKDKFKDKLNDIRERHEKKPDMGNTPNSTTSSTRGC